MYNFLKITFKCKEREDRRIVETDYLCSRDYLFYILLDR